MDNFFKALFFIHLLAEIKPHLEGWGGRERARGDYPFQLRWLAQLRSPSRLRGPGDVRGGGVAPPGGAGGERGADGGALQRRTRQIR